MQSTMRFDMRNRMGALRDPDAVERAMLAMRELCAEDVAEVLQCMERGASSDQHVLLRAPHAVDEIMAMGFRQWHAGFIDADPVRDASNAVMRVRHDAFGMVDDMRDACDGYEKVGVDTVRAWADTIERWLERLHDAENGIDEVPLAG